jgi:hypothetical protein
MRYLTDDDLRKLTPAQSAARSNLRYGYGTAANTP